MKLPPVIIPDWVIAILFTQNGFFDGTVHHRLSLQGRVGKSRVSDLTEVRLWPMIQMP